MITVDSTRRLSAKEALDRLQIVVHSMAPGSLLIEPVVTQKLWIRFSKLPLETRVTLVSINMPPNIIEWWVFDHSNVDKQANVWVYVLTSRPERIETHCQSWHSSEIPRAQIHPHKTALWSLSYRDRQREAILQVEINLVQILLWTENASY